MSVWEDNIHTKSEFTSSVGKSHQHKYSPYQKIITYNIENIVKHEPKAEDKLLQTHCVLSKCQGQLIPQEELKNVTSCDLPINVTCGSNEIIAVHSLYFWYHATCSGTCCPYDSSHFSAGADTGVIQAVRRKCSGENACSLVQLDGVRDFGSGGVHDPSYYVVKYYCIPALRTTSICSEETLTSAGEPLYLASENYPSVTTRNSTCSCSLEVFSCTSSVKLYIIDADLYLDETTCEQTIDFVDGTSTSLSTINCKSYYENRIDEISFSTNYVKIDFIDNSAQNQEGYIFLGFRVSEEVAFKLSCQYEQQTVCRDCGAPGLIPHGKLELVDSSNSSYGSLAKVSCDNGYESDDLNVSCLDTGQWENTACSLKDCGTPYDISNGTITPVINGSTTFGARANVICDEGFEIKGNCAGTQFQCGDGSCIDNSLWCDNFPHCDDILDELLCDGEQSCLEGQMLCGTSCVDSQVGLSCNDSSTTDVEDSTGTISCLVIGKWEIVKCSAKDCGNLREIQNGTISLTVINMTTYQSTAAVTCDAGFVASAEIISCQANGTWENASCITDCGPPQNATGASVTTSKGNIENSVATYVCTDGYAHTSGDLQRTCGSDHKWSGILPTCTPDCGIPANTTGAEVTTSAGTTENSIATYVCQNGFTHTSGNLTRTCGPDSTWNGTLPTCTPDCGDPDNVTGATFTTSSNNLESSVATYVCGDGYTHTSGDLKRTCTSDSTWNGTLPTCTPDCGTPPNSMGAEVTTSAGTLENSVATYVCQNGFKHTSGNLTRTCGPESTWDGTLPTCTPDCGDPDNVTGATFTTSRNNLESSVATYVCGDGYTHTSGDLQRTCTSDNTWNGTLPTCTPDCGTPQNSMGAEVTTSAGNLENSVATYVCQNGFTHTFGNLRRTCGPDSTLNGTLPTCTPDCGTPPNTNGAEVTTSAGTLENSVATYVCQNGFTHTSGNLRRTCGPDSTWDGTVPTCTPDCGDPDNVTGATFTTSSTNLESSVATYVCGDGYTHTSGDLQRTCTSDSTWNGTLPTCTPDCGTPPNSMGAEVTTSAGTLENSVATYVCQNGFTHTSGNLTRTCGPDSTWDGTVPTCTPDCGEPENVTGATVTTSSNNLESSVATYVCGDGYTHTSGDLQRTCTSNSTWNGTLPTCTPDCGTPPNSMGAEVTTSAGTLENSVATYVCQNGFTHTSGNLTRTCGPESTWDGTLPTCTPDCGDPDNVTGATFATSSNNLESSVATYVCGDGYTHTSGDLQRTCTSDSTWNGTLPTCTPDCGTPPNSMGAEVTTSAGNLENSVATYVCQNGFTHTSGNLRRTCGPDSNWDGTLPTCTPDCGDPENVTGATVSTSSNNLESSVATYVCGDGYTHTSGDLQRTCTSDSTWNGTLPTCTPDCGTPPNSMGAKVTTSAGTLENSVATYVCQNGFTHTSGNLTRTCGPESTWDGTLPTCTPDCGDPDNVTGATFATSSNNLESSVATYVCGDGYTHTSGDLQRTCTSDSTWNGTLPTCTPDCGTPPNSMGAEVTTSAGNLENSVATYVCQNGFTHTSGNLRRTCGPDSNWDGTLPTCTPDCGDPENVTGATVSTSSNNLESSVATYVCGDGYTHTSGDLQRTCTSDSTWNGTLPTCTPDCGTPPNSMGAEVTTSAGTLENSVAIYICQNGFTHTSGNLTRSCGPDSIWNGTLPTCTSDCGDPENVTGATVTTSSNNLESSVATYICGDGYTHTSGDLQRTCTSDSTWNGTLPTCTPDCGTPPNSMGAEVTTSAGTLENSVATYVCQNGFTHTSGNLKLTCGHDSTWNGTLPTCTPDCGDPENVNGATVTTSNKNLESSVSTYVCGEGYTHTSGDLERTCRSNSTWNGTIPTCTPDCEDPENATGATVTTSNKNLESSVATYVCGDGYTHTSGDLQRTCTSDSTWNGTLPTCTPDCGTPQNSMGAEVTTSAGTLENSVATYVCQNGFTHTSGNLKRTCGPDSNWDGTLPTCTPDCGDPENVTGATVTTSSNNLESSVAIYVCGEGYTHTFGDLQRTCRSDSTWNGTLPTCTPDCGIPSAIDNGTIFVDVDGRTTYLSTATVTCVSGFYPTTDTIICQANGTWEIVYCVVTDCGKPPQIMDGKFVLNKETQTTFVSSATVVCDIGYTATSPKISCQANGSWENASCEINDCGIPNTIDNGTISVDVPGTTTYLSTATVSCEEGFDASSNSTSCQASSVWQDVSCVIKDCGIPRTLDNGTIDIDTPGKTSYLSTATVFCDSGFDESSDSISCQANGTWQAASCVIKDCGMPPKIDDGNIEINAENKTTFGSKAVIKCQTGFNPSSVSVMCLANGTWTEASCTSKALDCGPPPNLDNGQITLSTIGMTQVGATAIVSCNIGYIKSVSSVTCLRSVQWQQASCDIIDCGDPPIIRHGIIEVLEGSFTTYDSVAHVTCQEGYRTEQKFVACEETGTWETSTCIPEEHDDDIFIILVAVGGAVLLLALIILVIISVLSKSRKTSMNLHHERMNRDFHNYDNNITRENYLPTKHGAIEDEDFSIDEAIAVVEGPPIENGGNILWIEAPLPEQGHIMSPDDINVLEENVFKQHEPHMWHTDMHTHTEGSEYDWEFSPYHF
ncbi:sushi, von Willebrand factor type A, EGF and pentraxin domain-containing protein 1-like isoform X5 [Mercenaria mercenaria]|uniref:sushi, von Willebrand factor type A, EGF and pentraxin domain-containing protein 1-like isoform X5 n=1 Tax=Mercenaria mercenaria TaxID=6596 RepID=UPI00234E5786|nr:sushi, von Willebrand factor type A, EGF and pentraxin domain-containing protein 1-like isoform X5 [Mercenaria mercenaria]